MFVPANGLTEAKEELWRIVVNDLKKALLCLTLWGIVSKKQKKNCVNCGVRFRGSIRRNAFLMLYSELFKRSIAFLILYPIV